MEEKSIYEDSKAMSAIRKLIELGYTANQVERERDGKLHKYR